MWKACVKTTVQAAKFYTLPELFKVRVFLFIMYRVFSGRVWVKAFIAPLVPFGCFIVISTSTCE